MDMAVVRVHRLTNLVSTVVLLLGMGLLLLFTGYLLAGPTGAWYVAGFGLVTLLVSPRIAPGFIMRLYQARPLSRNELPELQRVLAVLSERAGLPRMPELYYVPTQIMNAFTVGTPENAAIGVTDGLLRSLTLRELSGVLAHEVSHLMNNDLRVMTLADMVSRMTASLSHIGQFLLILNFPLLMTGQATVSWLGVFLLLAAPVVSTLLQLALSRRRELDADLSAYALTGDARGLASALQKMERYESSFLDILALPGRRVPDPSVLRTHPNTEERIRRLLELEGRPGGARVPMAEAFNLPPELRPVERGPRLRPFGLWY